MATNIPFPTINVIPAGYRWSRDAANKAAAKNAFIRVGGQQVSRRFLSGAKRSWQSTKPEESQTIFSTQYRITGTPQAVSTALQYAGVSQQEIAQVLANAITRDNFASTMAGEVARELQAHQAGKGAKPVAEGYDWDQILWFAQNIKTAQFASKTGEAKGAVVAGGKVGASETIPDKLKKLVAGKVLDVSEMDIQTGKGVRTKPAPKTAKAGKYGTGRVPIISNDLAKYIRALQLAYGPDAETVYAADIQVVRDALAKGGATLQAQVGVVMPKVPTPRPVGATVVAQPTFVPKVATPTRTLGGAQLPQIPTLGGLVTRQ